ncbi:hypothetical protein AGABI1DRAFT_86759 [Agaricus bisporus var. burnettii JB137-S8]|uniref:GED domain-containing protein n=1 Tax=Agaricus bisporus var. burnettii (strain JB137-S8 / ATCC MYA-4627 / FGSC 10392) TaxID=597362 RepID=K5WPE6_AGABU|nr:uncharacterized protein AGABI1DRAFT_86759 [Agaricus bisporus var. burnettii JB137-S8]EKM77196.1 hypothetical protein AGABI1DRAFT_86759 [Agaricus bisporus var. burnettii JB137-S8]
MTLLKDLRALGADTVFDLPKIVVIGNQSAGKSSLIEAVTGINVPRDSGTCTRCPMECSMSSDARSWSCTISLRSGTSTSIPRSSPRRLRSTKGASIASASSAESAGVTPTPARASTGVRNITTQSFGPTITDKSQVELWLRRAQGAILSTDADKSQWLNKSAEEIRQAIQNKTEMRDFTEDTIVVDIQDPTATDLSFVDLPGLISNADPGSIDLIKNLVRQHVAGENTLILVTIPASDDIQNHGAVVLAKEADGNGDRTIVVLTKPDSLGPGDTGLQETWRQTFKNRNVPENQNYLRHGYYCVQLPNDQQRQQGLTAHTLPNYLGVTWPWSEFAGQGRFGVTNLVKNVSALLVQMIEANLSALRAAIELALRQCVNRLGQLPPVVSHDNEMASILLMVNAFLRELEAASSGESHKSLAQECRRRYRELRDEVEGTCPKFQRNGIDDNTYDIPAVRKVIDECTGWELPGIIPYDAYKTLIKRFLAGWKDPVHNCFDDVHNTFSAFVTILANKHFSGFSHLNAFVLNHIRLELQSSKSTAQISVLKLLDIEKQPPFSQRGDFGEEQEKWMRTYWSHFFPHESDRWYRTKDEIHVMATVRTYFKFAFERFADTVLLMQEQDLVKSLRPKLEEALYKDVTDLSGTPNGLERLLAEDEAIAREREELKSRKERMTDIRNRLNMYGTV